MLRMEASGADTLVKQLATGFDTLQKEYQKLFGQYRGLERKLATAREQYNELVKLCDSGSVTTPPLSLTSTPGQKYTETTFTQTVSAILEHRPDPSSKSAAEPILLATQAAALLCDGTKVDSAANGVRIWSGASADLPERSSSMMPSISESPLEQDFTVEGKPSKLGCPFASMAGKKLSSHAASVLSRYNPAGSTPGSTTHGGSVASVRSLVNRVNGRESLAKRVGERRPNRADPIKAEMCGMDSYQPHLGQEEDHESPLSERATLRSHVAQQHEAGVCPIRFLDQHSPEEVATYFENHKHELPRSHEICVRRYQSNENQIRELDAKYGNLVSMIQGLGEKHQNFLPKEPDSEELEGKDDDVEDDGERKEKVRKWASSISAQHDQDNMSPGEERTPHFERPLRDIRVGESPSRPWGISVPANYIEAAAARGEGSSSPVKLEATALDSKAATETKREAAKCPVGFNQTERLPSKAKVIPHNEELAQPIFITPELTKQDETLHHGSMNSPKDDLSKKMVFTGPVFVGYSAEDAARILRESGLSKAV